jgi:hypothetical protein
VKSINQKLAEVTDLADMGALHDLAEEAPYLLQCLSETLDRILEWGERSAFLDKEKAPREGRKRS